MKKMFEIGDLVYVPSDVTLFSESKTHRLDKPINLLITGKKDDYYEVLFNGKPWYVGPNNLYTLKERV